MPTPASLFLAKVWGLYYLIVGILMLLRFKSMEPIYRSFFEIPGLMIISGFLALIIGILMIVTHNLWVWGWPVLITLLGWLSLLAGIVRISFAENPPLFLRRLVENHRFLRGAFLFFILLGAYLIYAGFFAS